MMANLEIWQKKIQENRKNTSWRDFIKEIASWYPLMMYKNQGYTSIFPDTDRVGNLTSLAEYNKNDVNTLYETLPSTGNFFQDFAHVFRITNKAPTIQFGTNENAGFAHCVFRARNVYLSFIVGEDCENIMYSSVVYSKCSNVYNSVSITNNSHNIYASKGVTNSLNIFYSLNIHNSSDVLGSSNLIGCRHCINCDNLQNQSYVIENKIYDKETYFQKKKEIYFKQNFSLPTKKGNNLACENVKGAGLFACTDVENGLYSSRISHGRNVCYIGGVNGCTDFYDVFEAGVNSSNFYAVCNAGTNTHYVYCSSLIDTGCSQIYYSYHLESCSYCLGCVGLRNKQFCIFNKQYSKEEWHQKVDEIFTKMEQDGVLGLFFPAQMNPFYFNDTPAYLIDDSFTKEEIIAEGYLWRDEAINVDIPPTSEIIHISEIDQYQGFDADGNRQIDPMVLKKVIKDDQGNIYRILKMEYDFLVKHSLSLPKSHWLERIKTGLKF